MLLFYTYCIYRVLISFLHAQIYFYKQLRNFIKYYNSKIYLRAYKIIFVIGIAILSTYYYVCWYNIVDLLIL